MRGSLRAFLHGLRGRRVDDDVDGCELDFTIDPTPDDQVDGLLYVRDRGSVTRGPAYQRELERERGRRAV